MHIFSDEIHDLADQLSSEGRSLHELEKGRKRMEIEKEEMQAALEEAESALEQEEAKVMRAQLEVASVRSDIDRRIQDKDEEFDTTRYVVFALNVMICSPLDSDKRAVK